MESLQDFGGSSIVEETTDGANDTSLPKARDSSELCVSNIAAADPPELGADHAAREILAALSGESGGRVENLSKLNAGALLRECMNLFVDGESATSQHEELWSVGDGVLLWALATTDVTELTI